MRVFSGLREPVTRRELMAVAVMAYAYGAMVTGMIVLMILPGLRQEHQFERQQRRLDQQQHCLASRLRCPGGYGVPEPSTSSTTRPPGSPGFPAVSSGWSPTRWPR
jgi:hypothetical protein